MNKKLQGESLTAIEQEVLEHVVNGLTDPQIAEALNIGEHRIMFHLKRIGAKAGLVSVKKREPLALDLLDTLSPEQLPGWWPKEEFQFFLNAAAQLKPWWVRVMDALVAHPTLSYSQIAHELGISHTALRSRLDRLATQLLPHKHEGESRRNRRVVLTVMWRMRQKLMSAAAGDEPPEAPAS